MTKTKYGIIKTTLDLLRVPHKEGDLTVSFPAFGSDFYLENIKHMRKSYFYLYLSTKGESKRISVSFRPASTSESISVVSYNLGNMARPPFFIPVGFKLEE